MKTLLMFVVAILLAWAIVGGIMSYAAIKLIAGWKSEMMEEGLTISFDTDNLIDGYVIVSTILLWPFMLVVINSMLKDNDTSMVEYLRMLKKAM